MQYSSESTGSTFPLVLLRSVCDPVPSGGGLFTHAGDASHNAFEICCYESSRALALGHVLVQERISSAVAEGGAVIC